MSIPHVEQASPLVSPGTRLVAAEAKATNRPSAEIAGLSKPLSPLACRPCGRWVLSRSANPLPLQGFPPRRRLLARTYRHLDLDERRTLFRLVEARQPVGEIARRLGRHPSTIHRELGRNRFRDGDRGFCGYFPLNAH